MRQRSGAPAKCARSDALYSMKRRLMISVVSTISAAGAAEARSCAEATMDAPANTMSDISIATSGGMPLATIATPVITPNGMMPRSTGSVARAPAANAGWCSRLEIAARQLRVADDVSRKAHLLGVALAQRQLDRLDVGDREQGERAVGQHHQVRALDELFQLELLGGGIGALLRKAERGLGSVHEGDRQSAAFFFRHGPSRCRRAHFKATSRSYFFFPPPIWSRMHERSASPSLPLHASRALSRFAIHSLACASHFAASLLCAHISLRMQSRRSSPCLASHALRALACVSRALAMRASHAFGSLLCAH